MSNNFKNSQKPQYRKPTKLSSDWSYIGDGKLHDPTNGALEMHNRKWIIDFGYNSGKGFEKFKQGLTS